MRSGRLSRRERAAVALAVAVAVTAALLRFAVFPMTDRRARLTAALETRQRTLAGVRGLTAAILSTRHQIETFNSDPGGHGDGSLFARLDRLAGKAGVKKQMVTMKPSTVTESDGKAGKTVVSTVEIQFRGIPLAPAIDFLERAESPDGAIRLTRLSLVNTDRSTALLDVVCVAETTRRMVDTSAHREAAVASGLSPESGRRPR